MQYVSSLVAALSLLPAVLVATGARDAMVQSASGTLVFAGCDSNIPITRLLARAFMQKHPEVRIHLKTVGSTAPEIPMLFMGQEFLEDKQWSDNVELHPELLLYWKGLDDGDKQMHDHLRFTRELVGLR